MIGFTSPKNPRPASDPGAQGHPTFPNTSSCLEVFCLFEIYCCTLNTTCSPLGGPVFEHLVLRWWHCSGAVEERGEDGASLKEVGRPWMEALRFHSMAPLPVYSLPPCHHAFPPRWLASSQTLVMRDPSSLKLFLVRYLILITRKEAKTPTLLCTSARVMGGDVGRSMHSRCEWRSR